MNIDLTQDEVRMRELGKDGSTTFKITIEDEKTGEVLSTHGNINGGAIIVAQGKPDELRAGGTRQVVFGNLPEVIVCWMKSKKMFGESLRRILGDEKFKELEVMDLYK